MKHARTDRCWFCATEQDAARAKAGKRTVRPLLTISPPSACPYLNEDDESLRPVLRVIGEGE